MIKHIAWTLAVGLASLEGAEAAAAQPVPTTVVASQEGRALDGSELAQPNHIVAESAVGSTAATTAVSLAAQEPNSDTDKWEVTFTPYLWIAGTKGDIGIPRGDNEVEIDRDFADTLSNLKFAFMGALDVKYDRFVAITDIMYLSVGAEAEAIRDPQFFEGEIDASVFVSTLALGYRVVDRGPMFVDIVAGGRIVSLDVELELTGPLTTRRAAEKKTSVAPLVGGRVRVPLGRDFGLALYGDVGGFNSSAVKWQAIASVQWEISRHWRLAAGYRHMAIKHDKNDLHFDVALSGPIVGVSYRF